MVMSDQKKGFLITVMGVLLVVPDSLFVRLISSDPIVTSFWRSASAGSLVLLGILAFYGASGFRNLRMMGWLGWLYTLLIGSTAPAFVFAVTHTSVASVVFILASMPIFSAAFSYIFLKETIELRNLVTIFLVILGLSFVCFGSINSDISSWRGDVWALYVSIAYAGALTVTRRLKSLSVIPAIPFGYIGAALVMTFFVDPFSDFSINWVLYLVYGGFIALGTCLLAIGPRFISSPEVALLILLEAVLAPLLVWFVLNENPGHWTLIGGGIVIFSLLISNIIALGRVDQSKAKKNRSRKN